MLSRNSLYAAAFLLLAGLVLTALPRRPQPAAKGQIQKAAGYAVFSNGLALELTAKGTKYYKDDELN